MQTSAVRSDMPKRRPPYLHSERTRHDALVWYVRRHHGARIRLRADYGSPAFWQEYNAALEAVPALVASEMAKGGTLKWALDRYRASSAWAALSPATRRQRENILR